MKINFEGQVRVLDLDHIRLKHAVAVQEYTGLPLLDWQRSLIDRSGATQDDFAADPAGTVGKLSPFADRAWITNMAAAHWLMLAQAGGDVPPLDDDYDCGVVDFALALYSAAVEEVKARKVPDKPDPTAPRARRTPSSRRTAAPKTVKGEVVPLGPLPRTGS